MLKRHENSLSELLERLLGDGWVAIEWWQLRLWYNAERIGKNIFRDLQERVAEMDDEVVLYTYDDGDRKNGSLLLVCGNHLRSLPARLGEESE